MPQTPTNTLDALNGAFDRLPPRYRLLAMAVFLVLIPVGVCLLLGTAFEDESAQVLWLIWVLWLLIPRIWYCHTRGRSPWRR